MIHLLRSDCQEHVRQSNDSSSAKRLAARASGSNNTGQPDAPVFPIGYAEREELKMGGLPHIVARVCKITCRPKV